MRDFIHFVRTQGIVGLAIGFILGGAVSRVVQSLVNDVINPTIGAVFGSTQGLAEMMVGPIKLGAFATTTIDFLIIAAIVYFGFKGLQLERFDEKKE